MATPSVQKIDALIDDDVNIIVEVLKKTKSTNVIINIPDGNDLLNSTVGLKLLQKNATKLGKKIALRVSSESSLNFIRNLHIPVGLEDSEVLALLQDDGSQSVMDQVHSRMSGKTATGSKPSSSFRLATADDSGNEEPLPAKRLTHTNQPQAGEPSSKRTTPQTDQEPPSARRHVQTQGHSKQGQSFLGFDFAKGRSAPTPRKTLSMPAVGGFGGGAAASKTGGNSPQWMEFLKSFSVPFKGLFVKIAIAAVLLLTVGFIIYYQYFPKVRIDLTITAETIQSPDLSISATSAITGFDKDKKQIQLLKEQVSNSGSKTIKASGTSVTGNKATGTVTLYNSNNEAVNVKAGTTLTASTGGLKFVTNQAVSVPKGNSVTSVPGEADVGVTAAAVGEEYNLQSGNTFTTTVAGVVAQNNLAFGGGTKTSKTVISQKDVDDNVKELQKQIAEENKGQLEFRHQGDNFIYVAESVKADLDGKPKVDPAVGSEANEAYLEIKVKSTALYYQEAALETLVTELLKDQYRTEKTLPDSSSFDVTNFTKEIKSIKIEKNDILTIVTQAKGQMVPKTDLAQLESEIRGRSWDAMVTRIKEVPGQLQDANIQFFPNWLPKFLYYVPKEDPRVEINVQRVEQ